MKATLQMNVGQSLTLTPQLQQAIRLLQLSTQDLTQEIQHIVDNNPMLEVDDEQENQENYELDGINNLDAIANKDNKNPANDIIPGDLPVDTVWDDIYPSTFSRSQTNEETPNFENIYTIETDLHDHLLWQLQLTPFSETDQAIAAAIIDAVNDDGVLTLSLEDIQHGLSAEAHGEKPGIDEIEMVLHRIQHFDPIGIASRNLQECLLLQLEQFDKNDSNVKRAKLLIINHIDLLRQHNYPVLMQRTRWNKTQLQSTMKLIQSLNPRPGSLITPNKTQYIVPDVVVKKTEGRWVIELNADALPKVHINTLYSTLVQRANKSVDNIFLRDNLQEARWFLKSLQSRHDTLLKVASCIVEQQQDFLEYGEEAMKPLILHDIAEKLDVHESTISRITTQKFMLTPRGVFELKYFFSSHVNTNAGGECSSTAIRAVIKKMIAAENPQKPLSDNKIAQVLSEQGIKVARRTIAKYRESMSILASNERKTLVS